MTYVLGIDVGSGSARCGVFDQNGTLLGTAKQTIAIHRPAPNHVEQSSTDIWSAICAATKGAVAQANVAPDEVISLSFSATCSLVLLDQNHAPLPLSEGGEGWNIIMWMDHRASAEAGICNATGASVLNNLGGAISLEMQIPKLMWLKRQRPELWNKLGYAADLADYLAWRCTGENERSICTVGCKWTYDADNGCWDDRFFNQVGLPDLRARAALPDTACEIGAPLGALTQSAADDLGLTTQCHVAVGLIDAHAGALGTSGLFTDDTPETRLALIAGTSNCHIALTKNRIEVSGVWGPYYGAVKSGLHALEGGQSATGAMLDQIVVLFARAQSFGDAPHGPISETLMERMATDPDQGKDVMVLPDFIGNRSPYANPDLRGAIMGLTLEEPGETFLKVYWAACASIAYGTRQIIDAMRAHGVPIDKLHLSGGHAQSALLVQIYADATGCDVLVAETPEPVLLGAAIAAAAPLGDDFPISQGCAVRAARIISPNPIATEMHTARYAVFCAHYEDDAAPAAAPVAVTT
ncbi:FGGY family pentulose kinase [uncultured Tateyamaria sp.]|uniref:FGGY-family carbohydrate kinase n=1 Tax=uncultured Tateyamaria sp. TaxID=455651 RepID=UPI0026280C3D|nr:FGGY family pentulose kinase [uncultured Tateyamaria sp.]